MPVDWKAVDSADRLLSAIVASVKDQKLDMRRIAALYGRGASHDSIENRFRTIKKDANKLCEEVENGERPAVAPKSNPRVISGRVTKTKTSPRKRATKSRSNDIAADDSEDEAAKPSIKTESGNEVYNFSGDGVSAVHAEDDEEASTVHEEEL